MEGMIRAFAFVRSGPAADEEDLFLPASKPQSFSVFSGSESHSERRNGMVSRKMSVAWGGSPWLRT
jgi:hypothetical protein